MTTRAIVFNQNGGTGGQTATVGLAYELYTTSCDMSWYDGYWTGRIYSVATPTKPGSIFDGYYLNSFWPICNHNGRLVTQINRTDIPSTYTATAYWRDYAIVSINLAGGSGASPTVFYKRLSDGKLFSDTSLTDEITGLDVLPSRSGYDFSGAILNSCDIQAIDAQGNFTPAFLSFIPSDDLILTCTWNGRPYTLFFDYNGGTGQIVSKQVTMGSAVGELPTATLPGTLAQATLVGWSLNGTIITSVTNWSIAGNATAVAVWSHTFGKTVDYFGAEGNLLMLVSSNPGEFRNAVYGSGSTGSGNNLRVGCLAIQTADSSKASFWRGPVLKNPTCTYRIRGSGSVSFTLGTAWNNANGKYFLTQVEYKTGADQEPLLVLSATANEGENAINLWTVTFNVSPDHVAQDPLSAISGGGEMTACTTVATAEPVVPYENGEPCASDIVHGKVVVSATTNSYFGEAAPTARSENSFIETNGVPCSMSDVDFKSYEIVAERSL